MFGTRVTLKQIRDVNITYAINPYVPIFAFTKVSAPLRVLT